MFMVNVGKYTSPMDPLGILQISKKPTKFYQLAKSKRPAGPFLIPASAVVYYQTFSNAFQKNACWQKIRSVASANPAAKYFWLFLCKLDHFANCLSFFQ